MNIPYSTDFSRDFSPLDALVEEAIGQQVFPAASLLVGRGERILYRKAYGRLDPTPDSPLCNVETRFDLASITKPLVTATLTLLALEEGKLCLWDPLQAFFPELPEDKRDITVRQLLLHTAGFSGGLQVWKEADSCEEAFLALCRSPLLFAPGTQAHYACAGYILVGRILEKLYRASLREIAQERIFRPLRMEHTSYCPKGDNIAATERQSDGVCLQGIVHDETARLFGGVCGNAGVFSIPLDLSFFLKMIASDGKLPDGTSFLSPASVRLMKTNFTPGMEKARSIGFHLPCIEDGYTGDLFPPETIGHTGFTGGSITLDPTSGLFLIFLTNRVCPHRNGTEIHRVRRLVHNLVYSICQREPY